MNEQQDQAGLPIRPVLGKKILVWLSKGLIQLVRRKSGIAIANSKRERIIGGDPPGLLCRVAIQQFKGVVEGELPGGDPLGSPKEECAQNFGDLHPTGFFLAHGTGETFDHAGKGTPVGFKAGKARLKLTYFGGGEDQVAQLLIGNGLSCLGDTLKLALSLGELPGREPGPVADWLKTHARDGRGSPPGTQIRGEEGTPGSRNAAGPRSLTGSRARCDRLGWSVYAACRSCALLACAA